MRYWEIIAEADAAEAARKAADKALKARQKIADAQTKKSRAAQTYQDSLRSANDAQAAAQRKLSST